MKTVLNSQKRECFYFRFNIIFIQICDVTLHSNSTLQLKFIDPMTGMLEVLGED